MAYLTVVGTRLFLSLLLGGMPLQGGVACNSAAHRQFDFWVGTWDVTDRHGQRLGTDHVEKTLDGCALHESWTGAAGVRGHSYSAWDAGDNRWRMTWVDNTGTVLHLAGGIVNDEMVLEGERRLPDGTPTTERITWRPGADGTVYQRWESSRDRGMRWALVSYGVYRKRSPGG